MVRFFKVKVSTGYTLLSSSQITEVMLNFANGAAVLPLSSAVIPVPNKVCISPLLASPSKGKTVAPSSASSILAFAVAIRGFAELTYRHM